MKKLILLASIAVTSLSACDREHTCTCEFYAANAPQLTLIADTTWIIEGKSFKKALVDCREDNGFEKHEDVDEVCNLD